MAETCEKLTVHPILNKTLLDCQTDALFLSFYETQEKETGKFLSKDYEEVGNPYCAREMIKKVIGKIGAYRHNYEVGDFVFFDDTQVMHKSAGPYEGRRMLYRTKTQCKMGFFKDHWIEWFDKIIDYFYSGIWFKNSICFKFVVAPCEFFCNSALVFWKKFNLTIEKDNCNSFLKQ